MQLSTGFYYISTLAANPFGEHWVQRSALEDKSFAPKPVAIQVNDPAVAEWYVEQIGDGNTFRLSASSVTEDPLPTIEQDGKLFVDITNSAQTNWTVTECGPNCDDNVYIIYAEGGNAWQTPQTAGDKTQILVQELFMTAIWPPEYPIYAQFKFASVGGSDEVD